MLRFYFISLSFLLMSSSLSAKTVCYEPSDDTSKFHLVWQGRTASTTVRENVEILCEQIKNYVKTTDEKFTVTVWTDENSAAFFREMKNCESSSTNGENAGSLSLAVRHVKELTDAEPPEQVALYKFLLEKNNFAGASDYTRLLAVKNNGGCYMDTSFRIKGNDFIAKALQNTFGSDINYFTAIGGGHEPESPMTFGAPEYFDFYKNRVPQIYENANTKIGLGSKSSAQGNPGMKFYNGFFAATKGHPITNAIYDEFTFKNKFFTTYRAFVEAVYDNCSSRPVVMSFMGQWAYNDVYFSFLDKREDLLRQLKALDLNKEIPYAGSNTWGVDNGKNCGMFATSFYGQYLDKRIVEASADKSGIAMRSYDSPDSIARKLLIPLVKLFRKEPASPVSSLSSIVSADMTALTRGINNTRTLSLNPASQDVLNICASSKDSLVLTRDQSVWRKKTESRGFPTIMSANEAAKKSLSVDLSYYVDDDKFDDSKPDDLYYGTSVICQEEVKDIFVPHVKIRPELAQMLSNIPKPIATLEAAYRRISVTARFVLKNWGKLDLTSADITDEELTLLTAAHKIKDLTLYNTNQITDAALAAFVDVEELTIQIPTKVTAKGIWSLIEAQEQKGSLRLTSLTLTKGILKDDDVKKLEARGITIKQWDREP